MWGRKWPVLTDSRRECFGPDKWQQDRGRNCILLFEPVDLHTKCCFVQTWPLREILLIQIHSNWNGLSWQELQLPRAKSFAWCNVFLFVFVVFLSFLCASSSTFICFPILALGLLFISSHVGLCLVLVLLFLCKQFILLPCHLITACVNSVLLPHHSLRMMLLSGLLTCVDACSFIGITAQVNRLHLRLVGPLSREPTHQQICFCFFVHPPVIFLTALFVFTIPHCLSLHRTAKNIYFLPPYCLLISSFATQFASDVLPSLCQPLSHVLLIYILGGP